MSKKILNLKDLSNIAGLNLGFKKASKIAQRSFIRSLEKTLKRQKESIPTQSQPIVNKNRNIKER